MKIKTTIASLALFAFAAAADTPGQVKAAIAKQMAGYVAAVKARDVDKVEAIIRANFAPEFKDVGLQGRTMDLEQMIRQAKSNISALKSVQQASLVITSLKVVGNKATTKEAFKLSALLQNPNDPKKTHTLKVDSNWTGTYVKRNGRWWCTYSKTTSEKVLFDGKKPG